MRIFSIILVLFFSTLASCKHDRGYVRELKSFIGTELVIDKTCLIPINTDYSVLNSEYKFILYMDSIIVCSSCWPQTIREVERHLGQLKGRVTPIIIFNSNDIRTIKLHLDINDVKVPSFLDVDESIKKNNKYFPKMEYLKSCLLKGDTVVVVGNPFNNSNLMEVYKRVLYD